MPLPPLLGLTDDTRDLEADPKAIAKAISVPDTQGLVSLEGLLAAAPSVAGGTGTEGAGGGWVLHRGEGGRLAFVPRVRWGGSWWAAGWGLWVVVPEGQLCGNSCPKWVGAEGDVPVGRMSACRQ